MITILDEAYSEISDAEHWKIESLDVAAVHITPDYSSHNQHLNEDQYNVDFQNHNVILPGVSGKQMIVLTVLQRETHETIFLGQCCLRLDKVWDTGGSFSLPLHYMEYPPKTSYDSKGKEIKMNYSHYLAMLHSNRVKHIRDLHNTFDINDKSTLSASEKTNGFLNFLLSVKLKSHAKCGIMEATNPEELCKYLTYFPRAKSAYLPNSLREETFKVTTFKVRAKTSVANLSLKKLWVACVDQFVYVYQTFGGVCRYIIDLSYVNIEIIDIKRVKGMIIHSSASKDYDGHGLPALTFISASRRECADWRSSFFIARRHSLSYANSFDYLLIQADMDKALEKQKRKEQRIKEQKLDKKK